jgi:hypothetical protein
MMYKIRAEDMTYCLFLPVKPNIPGFHYSLAQTGFFFPRHCPTSVAPGQANCERSELSSRGRYERSIA